jgi:hypothetical protein
MAKKKTPNDLHREAETNKIIRAEYSEFLKEQGKESSPDEAVLFAAKKIAGNYDYNGMKERELILFLAGELPYMYD